MIPAAHLLGDPQLFTNGSKTIFRAECACGLPVYGRLLWQAWNKHDEHLVKVRAQSRANHPSRRQP